MQRNLAISVAASYGGRLITLTAIYVFTPIFVRIMGVEAYGLIALQTTVLTFAALLDAGLSVSLSREAARSGPGLQFQRMIFTVEKILFGLSALAALAIATGAGFVANHWLKLNSTSAINDVRISIQYIALCVPFQLCTTLYISALTGLHRQLSANALLVAQTLLRFGAGLVVIAHLPSMPLFFLWQVISCGAVMLVARSQVLNALGAKWWTVGRPATSSLEGLWPFAGGMMLMSFIAAMNTQMDKVVTSGLLSITDFSHYSLASTLAQMVFTVIAPLVAATFPRVTHLVEENSDAPLGNLMRIIMVVTVIGAGSTTAILIFSPRDVLELWLGSMAVSDELTTTVRILSAGGFFMAIGTPLYYLALANGHSRTSVTLNIALIPATFCMLLFTTRFWGMRGAAVPWIFTHMVNFLVLALLVAPKFWPKSAGAWALQAVAIPSVALFGVVGLLAWAAEMLQFGALFKLCVLIAGAAAVSAAFVPNLWRTWQLLNEPSALS